MYQITTKLISKNRTKKPLKAKGIVLHETANPGAAAMNHYNYLNNTESGAAHYYVDWKEILHFIPNDEVAWHCKGGNYEYIGIELCHAKNKEDFEEAWKRGVWLFAKLLSEMNIKEVNEYTLPSHNDITLRKKIRGGHTDPIAYFKKFGKTVEDFRADVQKLINRGDGVENTEKKTNINEPSEWAKKSWQKACDKKVFDGTRPRETFTREEAAVLFDKLGLLK